MNSDPIQFEALRKLLALKRHEKPPPGYFNRLPDRITSRLECGEGEMGFWEKLFSGFSFRPAFAYAFAAVAFGVLGISVSESLRPQPDLSAQTLVNDGWRSVATGEAMASQTSQLEPMHVVNWMADGNPSNPAPMLPSLFGSELRNPALNVSFASPP
jgi:hypothetical protein